MRGKQGSILGLLAYKVETVLDRATAPGLSNAENDIFPKLYVGIKFYPIMKSVLIQKTFTYLVSVYQISSIFDEIFLAHLSRRLRGELIVYRSSQRPSLRACVRLCSHFQT